MTVASLTVSLATLALSYYEWYPPIYGIVGTYMMVDLLSPKKPDMILHHCLTLLLLGTTYQLDISDYIVETQTIINVEISTIFLSLHNILNDTIVPNYMITLNKVLFIVTFAKYRIWDYYWYLIRPNHLINPAAYGLGLLNLYWFTLLCRKLVYKVRSTKDATVDRSE